MRLKPLAVLLCSSVLLSVGVSGCAAWTKGPNSPAAENVTDQTSRESYDEFMAQMEEILAVTGEPTGWTADFGRPWPLEPGNMLTPDPCDPENWRTSPYQISVQVLGPGTEDVEADREAMIRYMEDQGMEVSGVFGDSSYPERVAWNAFGRGENGLTIDYGTSKDRRSVILHGECSTHPSMQNDVSRDAP